jgi:orotidine-5'-phosphate decarboxylase
LITIPAAAVGSGADYLIVRRPIVAAPDPPTGAETVVAEMRSVAARW